MAAFQEKLDELAKKVDDKKRIDDATDVDRAKREVKEEAGKAEVNLDLLHEKLIHLESVARRTNHESANKLNLILKRFNVHKKMSPSFVGSMVLEQISSKDEEAVLNKERKCYKQYNLVYPWGPSNNATGWGYGNMQNQMAGPNNSTQGWGYGNMQNQMPGFFGPGGHLPTWPMPQTQPPYPMTQAQAYMPHMQAQSFNPQQQMQPQPQWQVPHYMSQLTVQPSQPRYNAPVSKPRRYPSPSKQTCFKCNKQGHFVRNCPLN